MTTVVVEKDQSIFVTRRECNLHPLGFSHKKRKKTFKIFFRFTATERALEDNNMVTEESDKSFVVGLTIVAICADGVNFNLPLYLRVRLLFMLNDATTLLGGNPVGLSHNPSHHSCSPCHVILIHHYKSHFTLKYIQYSPSEKKKKKKKRKKT